tara:strand:+ start:194 stop:349 length:156 start_codon:yes stop_codon:yes gene_type:complete
MSNGDYNKIYMDIINMFNRLPWDERIVLLKLLKQHHKDAEKNPVLLNEDDK